MKTYSRKKQGEATDVIINLNELCRLCLAKEDELIPIFNDDDPVPLTLRIMACVSLEVFEGDGLPNMICHPCRYQLEKSYAFKKRCEKSDQKLRRHLKVIQEKIGLDSGDNDKSSPLGNDNSEEVKNLIAELITSEQEVAETETFSTEEDLVGARVAFIQPDTEPQETDPESITLPETSETNKDACTIRTNLKREVLQEDSQDETLEDPDGSDIFLLSNEQDDDSPTVMDQQELAAIADAVKATLANQPGINITGELQLKLDTKPGHPTQVEVVTEDGAVVLMELMNEGDATNTKVYERDDDDELKVFQCPDCPKAFARRIQLRRHASVHMQQRGFSCGICEKWFPTRSALVRHERIHTGERPFQCEVCQKSFAQKEILYRHFMTHTGQKPFQCPHCPKGFTQKEPLRVHMRSHANPCPSDIQLHQCTLCPKVFCHASGLSRHLVTHTGKLFRCRECEKSFTDKSSLRRHFKQTNHHP